MLVIVDDMWEKLRACERERDEYRDELALLRRKAWLLGAAIVEAAGPPLPASYDCVDSVDELFGA